MLVENKDYRFNNAGTIELWWNGRWQGCGVVAWNVPGANSQTTIQHRVEQAIAGNERFRDASLNELIFARPKGRKDLFVRRINQCPKVFAFTCFWLALFENVFCKLGLIALSSQHCGKRYYANGQCKYCFEIGREGGGYCRSKLSPEGLAKLKARDSSPERRRGKTLAARRRKLVPVLLEMQPDLISSPGVALILQNRFDDWTDEELRHSTKLLYEAYEAQWILRQPDKEQAVLTARARSQTALSRKEESQLKAALRPKK